MFLSSPWTAMSKLSDKYKRLDPFSIKILFGEHSANWKHFHEPLLLASRNSQGKTYAKYQRDWLAFHSIKILTISLDRSFFKKYLEFWKKNWKTIWSINVICKHVLQDSLGSEMRKKLQIMGEKLHRKKNLGLNIS